VEVATNVLVTVLNKLKTTFGGQLLPHTKVPVMVTGVLQLPNSSLITKFDFLQSMGVPITTGKTEDGVPPFHLSGSSQ
jgi:hypothetical protein